MGEKHFYNETFTIAKDSDYRVINIKRLLGTTFTLGYSVFILSTAVIVLNQSYSLPGIVAIGINSGLFVLLYFAVEQFVTPTSYSWKVLFSSLKRKLYKLKEKISCIHKVSDEHSNELVSTSDIFNAAKSSLSGNEWRSSVFDYALEHCPSIPKAASDDWIAAIPKVQKQKMALKYYMGQFSSVKNSDIQCNEKSKYLSINQIIDNSTKFIKSAIDFCLYQTQTPAYQTGLIVKSMLWSSVYIWATTRMYRAENVDSWNFQNVPEFYYFFESTFLWMLSYDYIIGLVATWYKKESTIRYIFSFYQIIDFLSLPPFLLLIINISPLYESSQSWLLLFGWLRFLRLFRTETVLDTIFPRISAVKRRIIGIFAGASTILLTYAGAIFTIESPAPKNYSTLFDFFYYSVVTIGTVGYGDFAPQTREGRLVTIVMITLTLVLLPQEFQRLKEALNAPSLSVGSFIKKNDRFLCIIGAIPPKQLLYTSIYLSQQKKRRFRSIMVITPRSVSEYQMVVKISQQRRYIRIFIKHGTFNSTISSVLIRCSMVILYGEGIENIYSLKNKTEKQNGDFDALISTLCLLRLSGIKEKLFLVFRSSQLALMTFNIGGLGVVSTEAMKMRFLGKALGNCPGFLSLLVHLLIPRNEPMLKKIQEPPQYTQLLSKPDRSAISPLDWQCRWRGLHFKVYTLQFPVSFHGYPISVFIRHIYKYLGIILIGIYCPNMSQVYLNPHLYIIGENSNSLGDRSNYLGLVLSSSDKLVKKAEKLEPFKKYDRTSNSTLGRRSQSPIRELFGHGNSDSLNKFKGNIMSSTSCEGNVSIMGSSTELPTSNSLRCNYAVNAKELSTDIKAFKSTNILERMNRALKKQDELAKFNIVDKQYFDVKPSLCSSPLQLPGNFDYQAQGNHDSVTMKKLYSLYSYQDMDKKWTGFGTERNFVNEEYKNNNTLKYDICTQQTNFCNDSSGKSNRPIPIVSSYSDALLNVFIHKEYPLVVIIGWCTGIDILIKTILNLRSSNFIVLASDEINVSSFLEDFKGSIAHVIGYGANADDQKRAGILNASRIIIFDSITSKYEQENCKQMIDIQYGKFAIAAWATVCYVYSQSCKRSINSPLMIRQRLPPIILDIQETDIGLLIYQFTNPKVPSIYNVASNVSINSEQSLLEFLYTPQFLSGQFFVEDIIHSIVTFTIPLLELSPISIRLIDHLIDGQPSWQPFNNSKYSTERSKDLRLEEVPLMFIHSTFNTLFSQLLRHGKLAIAIYRPLTSETRSYEGIYQEHIPTQVQCSRSDYNMRESPVIDLLSCETHIIIPCPPPNFKISLGDCVYIL
ncbi:cation channel family protein [Cryptosporidium serpentis]